MATSDGYSLHVTEVTLPIPVEEWRQEEVEHTVVEMDPETGEKKPKIIISYRNVMDLRYEDQIRHELVVKLNGEHVSTGYYLTDEDAWDRGEELVDAHRKAVIEANG